MSEIGSPFFEHVEGPFDPFFGAQEGFIDKGGVYSKNVPKDEFFLPNNLKDQIIIPNRWFENDFKTKKPAPIEVAPEFYMDHNGTITRL